MSKTLKALIEKREGKISEMNNLVASARAEVRAMTTEENEKFKTLKTEVEAIKATIKNEEELRDLNIDDETKKPANADKKPEPTKEERMASEGKEIKSIFENRAAMTTTVNEQGGAVLHKELSKEIIKNLQDRSNVLSFFNVTTIKGNFKIPKKTSKGAATWEDEQVTPNGTDKSTTPKLATIELGQNRLYRESAITQQMLNTEDLDLRDFVIDDISETMQDSIEAAVLLGDGSKKPTGIISGITKKITLSTRGTISFDDIKKCKFQLKKEAWNGARWFMNSQTLLLLDLIKDAEGRYILQPDITSPSGYTILGLPVELSDAMPTMDTTGANCIIMLANPKAYHINIQKEVALYVYEDSMYKRAGLIGYGSDMYLDGKIKNEDVVAGIFNPKA